MKKLFILALILSFIWAPIGHCAIPLKADTATVIVVGPFLDKTDGITAETAIVVSGTSCVAFKFNDTTQVAINLALTATGGSYDMVHIANGYYNFEVPTALVDTEGFLILSFTSSAAFLPQTHDYVVMDEIVYDSLYKVAATDYLRVDVTEIADTIVSAASAQLGVNVVNYGGDAVTDTVAGIPDVNVTYWEDDAVPASAAAGYPYVVIKDGTGTGEIDTDSGTVLLRSATETQIDNIEADTEAVDTQSELRTILVGADVSLTTNQMLITAADSTRVQHFSATGNQYLITAADSTNVNTILTAAPSTFIANSVWDEYLTGSTHNISTSAGKRLRQIEESFVHASGVIATVTDGHTFTLDAGAVATADYYVGDRLQITEGTGAGQSRLIVAYTSGKVVTLDSNFITNPDTSSLYNVDAADVHVSLSDADQAQGFVATYTDTTTITLDAGAVATADYYAGSLIVFTHGTGAGQSREITGYTSGRVVTMSPVLATALDTSTVWHIQAAVSAAEIIDEWELQSQSDPTGFHVNVKEVDGTGQTANDMSGDINDILTDTAAVDTQSELRTILVGADVSLTTQQMLITAADSCRVVAMDANVVTDAAVADAVKVDVNTILTAAPTTFIYSYSSLATNLIFSTDTMAEMAQGAPPGSPTMAQVLNYLYRVWRNKVTTTASSQGIYDDAGSAVLFKATISDDGTTFTKAEIVTGP